LKLASRSNQSLDGELFLVSRDLQVTVSAASIAPSLLRALETWDEVVDQLQALSDRLNRRDVPEAIAFSAKACAAPLPRAPQFLDASAFPTHGERMVKAFNLSTHSLGLPYPLMYQGCADQFLGACAAMHLPSEADGIDLEGEIAIFTAGVPMGVDAREAASYIRLFALVDDVSLRALQPAEMAMGFGMIHSKPTSVFSPVCVTPDELGDAYTGDGITLSMSVRLNGELLGVVDSGDMGFTFGELIAHAARTRRLAAGTIIGSGTLSNADTSKGCACLAEKRALEMLTTGTIKTGWLRFGDRVRIEVESEKGDSIFGAIDHTIEQAPAR
jgi:fumarylacetoacetate (FAA) hydrolase